MKYFYDRNNTDGFVRFPSVLFLFGILFIIGYLIHISIVCTKQSKMIIRLTQELGIEQNNNGGRRK